MSHSVITVIGKDRVGIVYDVSKLLIILVDTAKCPKSREEMLALFAAESKKLALEIRMQNEDLFNAMHRI